MGILSELEKGFKKITGQGGGGTTTTGEPLPPAPIPAVSELDTTAGSDLEEEEDVKLVKSSSPSALDLGGELTDIFDKEKAQRDKLKKIMPGITQQTMLNPLFMRR